LKVLPWPLPDLGFIELLGCPILHLNSEIVHPASNQLRLRLQKPLVR
jgi:hypothetical protein